MSSTTASTTSQSSEQSPIESIVSAVAKAEGVPETEVTPLYAVLDPEALEAVLESSALATVSFEFEGYEITVDGTGQVELRE